MFEDLRSPEVKAKQEREAKARERDRKSYARTVAEAGEQFAGAWHPIETMPFKAFAEHYGKSATVLLTDGDEVAIATVHKRFGRPIKVVEPAQPAITDHGMSYVGGKYEEFDHPKWWFDWEFTDELSTESEMWGKDEVGFVATHWQPLPSPPRDSDTRPQDGDAKQGSTRE